MIRKQLIAKSFTSLIYTNFNGRICLYCVPQYIFSIKPCVICNITKFIIIVRFLSEKIRLSFKPGLPVCWLFVTLVQKPHASKRKREGTQLHGWPPSVIEVQRASQWSYDHRPYYHPIHTPMPMLPSHESTKILIRTHPFTCANYNPFESLHIDHIGPLPADDKGNTHILVNIDAFSRWVEWFPTKTTGASETVGCIFQHYGRFGTHDVIRSGLPQRTLRRVIMVVQGRKFLRHSVLEGGERSSQRVIWRTRARQVVLRTVTHGTTYHEHWWEDVHQGHSCRFHPE